MILRITLLDYLGIYISSPKEIVLKTQATVAFITERPEANPCPANAFHRLEKAILKIFLLAKRRTASKSFDALRYFFEPEITKPKRPSDLFCIYWSILCDHLKMMQGKLGRVVDIVRCLKGFCWWNSIFFKRYGERDVWSKSFTGEFNEEHSVEREYRECAGKSPARYVKNTNILILKAVCPAKVKARTKK